MHIIHFKTRWLNMSRISEFRSDLHLKNINQSDTYCTISYWLISKLKILMTLAQVNYLFEAGTPKALFYLYISILKHFYNTKF
jgi:hypothetical protein